MTKNVMDDWAHGMPREVKDALSKEIDTKDNKAYGELSLESGDPFVLVANTWTQFVGWNEESHSYATDVTGDEVIIQTEGIYLVTAALSFSTTAAGYYEIALFVDSTIKHNVHTAAEYVPNAVRTMSTTGLVQLYPGDVVNVKMRKATGTPTITPYHGSIVILGIHTP